MTILGAAILATPSSTNAQAGSPAGPVPVERLQARRAGLLARLKLGVAIIPSAQLRSIEGDYPQDSDYREHNDFFYLTGLEAPGAWLVLVTRKSGQDQAVLYLPARDSIKEKWTGPRLGPGTEAVRLTGITDIRRADKAETEIRELVLDAGSPARAGAVYLSEQPRQDSESLRASLLRDGRRSRPVKIGRAHV